MPNNNVLIVEDDEEWRGNYYRAAEECAGVTIKVADSLATAESLIEAMEFALAFIDIGLNVGDDRNVDGLKVMGKIRNLGDQTSIIVVTGRSGRDVLPITRTVLKDYDAYEIVSKTEVGPDSLSELVTGALQRFHAVAHAAGGRAHEALHGDLEQLIWDHQVLEAVPVRDGVNGLYGFLDQLLGAYLPMTRHRGSDHVLVDSSTGVGSGQYWSRALGASVAFCFGAHDNVQREVDLAKRSGKLVGRYALGDLLRERSSYGLSGMVCLSPDGSRDAFE